MPLGQLATEWWSWELIGRMSFSAIAIALMAQYSSAASVAASLSVVELFFTSFWLTFIVR